MSDGPALIGRTLADRYRIEAELARGGMANVYRARDLRLDRDVAVKVLAARYADDPAFTARFLDEARAAASLSHPSLVHVYDSGSDGSSHYIVMELLDRHRTLRDRLACRGPAPARRGARHRSRAARRPAGGPRSRPRSLRRDAGERHARPGARQAHRLRDRVAAARRERRRHEHRLPALHVTRTAARRGAHAGERPLQPRCGSLRRAHRPPAVCRRDAGGDQRRPCGRRRTAAVDARRWGPRPPGRGDPPVAAEGSGRALHQRRCDGGLAGGVGRRHRERQRRRHDAGRSCPATATTRGGGLRAPRGSSRATARSSLAARNEAASSPDRRGLRSGRSSSSVPRRWSSCSWSCPSSNSVARAGEAGPRRRPHPPESPARM